MATTVTTLTQRTRRFLRDWPEFDETTASISSSGTTLTVANSALYAAGWELQLEDEVVRVQTIASGTTLTVRRGLKGSTAAAHVTATTIMARPRFYNVDILDALNAGLAASFPLLYRPVASEWDDITADAYEWLIPEMSGIAVPIPYIYGVEYQETTDQPFVRVRNFRIVRSEYPLLKFSTPLVAGGKLRIKGFGPFTPLTASGSLDTYFPVNAEDILVWFAAQYLLASGEAGRLRVDTGVIDDREQANRTGSSMSASNSLFQRFQMRLREAGMAPMPRHVVAVT